MLLTVLEIVVLLGAVVIPLMPPKSKRKALVKANQPTTPELSQYVVDQDGQLQELSDSRDQSLLS